MDLTPEKYVKMFHELGRSNVAVFKKLGISERHFYRWKAKHTKEIDNLLWAGGNTPAPVSSEPESPTDIQAQILKTINKETTLDKLSEMFRVTPRVVQAHLDDIRDKGYLVEELHGTIRLCKTVAPQENIYTRDWNGDKVIRFGVVSDTHLCNKWQQLTYLHATYDLFAHEGIDTVYHPGDVTDGFYKNRPGHIYELFRIGADEQADYVISHYPSRTGITTNFITGNHDHTHIINGGTNIGARIGKEREDMVYLGMSNAKVNLTPNCVLEINHPEDGSAYALSYALQKTIDAMSGGEKPNILLNGHHHKAFYMPTYRNVHSFECGTFEDQTPWMKGKKLAAHVGGFIIEVHVDEEGSVTRCKNEFIPYYKMIKNDYLNWQ